MGGWPHSVLASHRSEDLVENLPYLMRSDLEVVSNHVTGEPPQFLVQKPESDEVYRLKEEDYFIINTNDIIEFVQQKIQDIVLDKLKEKGFIIKNHK